MAIVAVVDDGRFGKAFAKARRQDLLAGIREKLDVPADESGVVTLFVTPAERDALIGLIDAEIHPRTQR